MAPASAPSVAYRTDAMRAAAERSLRRLNCSKKLRLETSYRRANDAIRTADQAGDARRPLARPHRPAGGRTSGIILVGLFERRCIAGASTPAPFSGARVTTITESSKNHQSVNPPTLQPRPIIGGERRGA
jgi:hypothetical protein